MAVACGCGCGLWLKCGCAQTDDMMWSYVVRGAPPEYKVPQAAPRIDNRMDPAIVSRMAANAADSRSRNVVRENMAMTKSTSKASSVGIKSSASVASFKK